MTSRHADLHVLHASNLSIHAVMNEIYYSLHGFAFSEHCMVLVTEYGLTHIWV